MGGSGNLRISITRKKCAESRTWRDFRARIRLKKTGSATLDYILIHIHNLYYVGDEKGSNKVHVLGVRGEGGEGSGGCVLNRLKYNWDRCSQGNCVSSEGN